MATHSSFENDRAKLDILNTMLSYRMDELLEKLGISFAKSTRMLSGCCPIHNGDNPNALIMYVDGHTVRGFWHCYTKGCHRIFKPTIIGFIRGVLSAQLGWACSEDTNKVFDFKKTVKFVCDFLGQDYNNIKIDSEEIEKRKFTNSIERFNKSTKEKECGIPVSKLDSHLKFSR